MSPTTTNFYYPKGIHSLPIELLSSIFVFGAGFDNYADSPFLLKPEKEYEPVPSSDFQVVVSHVCHHWREVALSTQSLWTTLHFGHPSHIPRAKAYLARCSNSATGLLDILVNTVSYETHARDPLRTLYDSALIDIFELIVPHVKRWRAFHLKISDHNCKGTARRFLSSCGPAPNLETLQLYHFEDFRTSQRLFEAIQKPPVTIFSNDLPRLRNVSLIGVNLGWDSSPYLSNLRTLELALHSENVRPFYVSWDRILQSSPGLQTLCLHYSGPKATTDDPSSQWPNADQKIQLKVLKELSLTSLDPDYLYDLVQRLYFPNLQVLTLDLPDLEYTSFITLLANPGISHIVTGTSTYICPVPPMGSLHNLQTLVIRALDCSLKSWIEFLHSMPELRNLQVDFGRVGDRALFWSVFTQPSTAPASGREFSAKGRCVHAGIVLPRLERFKFGGILGRDIIAALAYRYKNRTKLTPSNQIWIIGWNGHVKADIERESLIERGFWMPDDEDKEEAKIIIRKYDDPEEEEIESIDEGYGEEEEEEEEEEIFED
ncbi:hypothetical protein JR316_0007189 [Psilocybe cubensis]|uniref:F-box domain-containing protein n=2 Tax=Psilocybe cubensis TaxID=181762 RepID=A0A8H7XQ07_PSICU|nr:hypothetical protein JR316_0007189 [Psilocybe cubensis]KAH9480589.1 hypothetical protein JR316_0007189 [Psilocybe cubensis]